MYKITNIMSVYTTADKIKDFISIESEVLVNKIDSLRLDIKLMITDTTWGSETFNSEFKYSAKEDIKTLEKIIRKIQDIQDKY